MPRKTEKLTNSSIAQIRANQARRCSAILTRVAKFANGETDPEEMNQAQLKAAQLIINSVLPAQATSQVETTTAPTDIQATEDRLKQLREQLIATLTPDEIKAIQVTTAAAERETVVDKDMQ